VVQNDGRMEIGMRQITVPLLLLLTAARGAVTAAPVAEGACGVIKPTADQQGEFLAQPDLHPLTQAGQGQRFTLDAPAGSPVMCARASLLPVVNDAELVVSGHPFMIAEDPGERIGVLEVSDGKFRFRMVQGALTADEMKRLAPRLEDMRNVADKIAP
jgi:hypothetical protein